MIPRTFPSSVASNGSTRMIVYFLPSVSGLTRWVDYIPVKFTTVATATTENTYNQNGYIPVVSLSSIAGATPFKEYVPVFLDSSAVDADVWDVTITGFIPVGTAGIGGAALYLDFAATTSLDPRITFSRTTNATLTNSAGLVANAPMNLLTYSEQFDNAAWTKTGATVTANATAAPDGTLTADQITYAASGLVNGVATVPAPGSVVISVFAKAGTTGDFRVREAQYIGTSARFNLNTGTIIAGTGTITPAGNGWYRCSVLVTYIAGQTSGSYVFDSTTVGSLYLWGAQLEVGSTATTYNSTTVKNLLGYTENFDNAAWTKSNAFVQTNLVTYSQDFDNAAWVKTIATVTANSVVAPDGSTTADSVAVQSPPATSYMIQTSTNTSGAFSVFAKSNPAQYLILVRGTYGSGDFAIFDIINGTVTQSPTYAGSSAVITQGVNGWFRCVLLSAQVATINGISVSGSGTGTSTQASGAIAVWGAQLVQGTSAGDYKATYAAAAAVGYTDIYGQPFAQKLVEDTANSTHLAQQTVAVTAGSSNVINLYAKAAGRSLMRVEIVGSGSPFPQLYSYFNLDNGTAYSSAATSGATLGQVSMSDAGGGWYRCSVAGISSTATNVICRIWLINTGTNITYTGDGTSGIYIFGAQLSDSASVDPYVYQPVAAPSSTAYYGPRFDYDPVTLQPKGLLIEEQRTNFQPYSSDFTNVAYTKTDVTLTANSVIAPDGSLTGCTVTGTGTGNSRLNTQGGTMYGVSYTTGAVSFFAKAGSLSVVSIGDNAGANRASFNLSTGVPTATGTVVSLSMTPAGNGWYRCSAAFDFTYQYRLIYLQLGATYPGIATTGSAYFWGCQIEAGSAFATSYIPTAASQVTRAADSASMIGNNFARWYTQGVGSLFSQHIRTSTSGSARGVWALNDGTTSTAIDYRPNGGDNVVQISGATQADIYPGGGSVDSVVKNVLSFAVNNFSATTNAGTTPTDTSGNVPVVSQMVIGGLSTSTGQVLCGNVQRIAFYSRVLSSAEQKGITA